MSKLFEICLNVFISFAAALTYGMVLLTFISLR